MWYKLWYAFLITLLRVVFWPFNPIRARGLSNLPRGAAILCPNHTTMKDPIYIAVAGGYRHSVYFMAKEELERVGVLRALFRILPVFTVKRNSGDIGAMKSAFRVLREGKKLVVFPEGTRMKDGAQGDYKAGAAMLAAKSGYPLVPVYIENGRPFFRRVTVVFGRPFDVAAPDRQQAAEAYQEAARRLMREVEALRAGLADKHLR